MPARLVLLVLLAPLLAVISGCSQWYYELGTPLSQHTLPDASEGSTLGDVLTLLGPPNRLSVDVNGYVFAWEYWRVRENAAGVSLSPLGVEFLSVDVARVSTEGEFVLATFDSDHRLTAIGFSTWNNRVGDGQAIQPFGALDVATTGDLVSGFGEIHWYAGELLFPLPIALNRDSRLTNGANGLEQRATPDNIGQHSLEMR